MTVYFVSRHPGAQFWARYHDRIGALPLPIDRYADHFDPATTQRGDVVIGTLPLGAIAKVQERGGQFVSLDIVTPPERRGQELSATEMVSLGAVLTPYRVEALETRTVAAKQPMPAPDAKRSVTLMLVSDQLPPQLIGLDVHPSTDVWLVTTPAMQDKARVLQGVLAQWGADAPATQVHPIQAGSYHALWQQAQVLLDAAAQQGFGRILLNATGGTKPMMMAFVQAAMDAGRQGRPVQVCYVDTAEQTADSLTAAAPQRLRRVLNIEQLLACSGRVPDGAAHPSEEFRGQMERGPLNRHLLSAPEAVIRELNGSADAFDRLPPTQQAHGRIAISPALAKLLKASYVKRLPPLGEHLFRSGVLRAAPQLDGDAAFLEPRNAAEVGYLKGGWLEAYVADCLARCGADEWAAGLQVKGDKRNELDGVLAAGNRLLVLEVKTKNQRRVDDADGRNTAAEQAVYKLDSVGGQLAPVFGERWYVSARPLDVPDLERAQALRIRVFAPQAGELGQPIAALEGALAQWVLRSQGGMEASPRLRPSAFGIDKQKWGKAATRSFDVPARAGSSVKPQQEALLRGLKKPAPGATPTLG